MKDTQDEKNRGFNHWRKSGYLGATAIHWVAKIIRLCVNYRVNKLRPKQVVETIVKAKVVLLLLIKQNVSQRAGSY